MRLWLLLAMTMFAGWELWSSPPASVEHVVQRVIQIEEPPAAQVAADAPLEPVLAPEPALIDGNVAPAPPAAITRIPSPSPADPFQNMLKRLRASLLAVQQISSYSATLEQQVEVGGTLHEPEFIDLKLRREPFSVYLIWQHDQQEVLYVAGQNDGKLLARPKRGIAAIRGVWRLRPDSSAAMKGARYPVTELGIEKLCEQALRFHQGRNFSPAGIDCTQAACVIDGRPATKFTLVFDAPGNAPEYSRSVLMFDDQSQLLVSLENDRWGEHSEHPHPLLERYVYHAVVPANDMSDDDFSPANPVYGFARK